MKACAHYLYFTFLPRQPPSCTLERARRSSTECVVCHLGEMRPLLLDLKVGRRSLVFWFPSNSNSSKSCDSVCLYLLFAFTLILPFFPTTTTFYSPALTFIIWLLRIPYITYLWRINIHCLLLLRSILRHLRLYCCVTSPSVRWCMFNWFLGGYYGGLMSGCTLSCILVYSVLQIFGVCSSSYSVSIYTYMDYSNQLIIK